MINNMLERTLRIIKPLSDKSAGFWYDLSHVLLYVLYVRYRRRSLNGNDSALSFNNWMRKRQRMPLVPASEEH
jgi:hypothetical protein